MAKTEIQVTFTRREALRLAAVLDSMLRKDIQPEAQADYAEAVRKLREAID